MKLVQVLAKELAEWPNEGWPSLGQASNGDLHREPFIGGHMKLGISIAEDWAEAEVTRAQWQAERERQKGGEWKRHRGGKCPVADEVQVEVKFRDGDVVQSHASDFFSWKRGEHNASLDILQYRIISEPQAEEVEMVSAKTIEAMDATDRGEGRIFNSAQDLYAALDITYKAKTDQIDGPIKWRDTVNELDAYIEKFTRERDALIDLLASEGFALIPPVVSVMSEFDGADMSDWRNWRDGDIVEVVFENDADLPIGKQCVVATIEKPDYIYGMPVSVYDEDANDGSFFWPEDITEEGSLVFKFVRRP